MRRYMLQLKFSAEAVKALVAKPQNRKREARKAIKQMGGRLVDYYFTFGDWDAVLIFDLESDTQAFVVDLINGATGVGNTKITVLHSMDDAVEAMKIANQLSYRPPGD